MIHDLITTLWYSENKFHYLLTPLSLIYCAVVSVRRWLYLKGYFHSYKSPVPVIIVGNISVGGTGKTPLIIDLANRLGIEGYKVGILCRGYKGKNPVWPVLVTPDSDPVMTGDEAVLIAQRTQCPVVAGPDRVESAKNVYDQGCNIILSDDGLQHYALHRDIEILMLNDRQGKYNTSCLPAGPFRENQSRIGTVDFVISSDKDAYHRNFWQMSRRIEEIRGLSDEIAISMEELKRRPIHAIAGIGNPGQFFEMLEAYGLTVIRHSYPDHFHLSDADFEFNDDFPIVMTEKDAVKYSNIVSDRCSVTRLEVDMDPQFYDELSALIRATNSGENIG